MITEQLTERPDPLAHVKVGDLGSDVPIPGSAPQCWQRIYGDPFNLGFPCTRTAGHIGKYISSTMTEVLAVGPQGGAA